MRAASAFCCATGESPHFEGFIGGRRQPGWHTEPMGRHRATDTGGRFHHSTLFYEGDDGFLDGTLPFVREGVAAEEPILIAVAPTKIEMLRRALGEDAEGVHFVDMHALGRNPARIIPAWRRFLADRAPDKRPVRGIGEPIWAGRSDAELIECQRHESLLNLAFEDGQAWRLLCPYDLDALDDQIIEAARRSHPFVAQEGLSNASDAYLQRHEAPSPFAGVLPAPSTQPRELTFTSEKELGGLRRFVSRLAASSSLDTRCAEDLVLSVNELATNSLRYGGGAGTLQMWTEAGALLCEVRDRGHITEPLVGRDAPEPRKPTGRGLWVVNHLCDLVQIRSTPWGSVVRVHMRLA
jgi:anti-sigma regulatory factor (Ser/Thr protein kinase)